MVRKHYEKDLIVASRNGQHLTYDEESHDTHIPIWFVLDAPPAYPTSGYLYRFFGEGQVLLYVVKTINPRHRMRDHASDPRWYDIIRRVTWEEFPRDEILMREAAAIREENPLYNIRGKESE